MTAAVEPLDVEQLLGKRRQPRGILQQPGLVRTGGQRFQPRVQNRDRRAQFVRGIRNKALVTGIALVEPRQRVVDCGDQRHDLQRNSLHRQPRTALMDVDAPRLIRGGIQPPEGALHDHRRRDEGRGAHHEQAGQGDAEKRQRGHEQRLGTGQPALRRGDDLHIAGVGLDALQPRRRLARIVLEHLPAEPRLADLVEAAADRREFRLARHLR